MPGPFEQVSESGGLRPEERGEDADRSFTNDRHGIWVTNRTHDTGLQRPVCVRWITFPPAGGMDSGTGALALPAAAATVRAAAGGAASAGPRAGAGGRVGLEPGPLELARQLQL